jgi:methylamine dehydrogenase heavy chain
MTFSSKSHAARRHSDAGHRSARAQPSRSWRLLSALLVMLVVATSTQAQGQTEKASVATLPDLGDHLVWVGDRLLQHNVLFDGDAGEVLGMIDSPTILTPKLPMTSRERGEIYSVDIAYSRGTRGERIDYISIYDIHTLNFVDEIIVPTEFGTSNASYPYNDKIGDRFIGVFNQFPNTSISIIDLVERKFVEEIITTGCSGIYPIDDTRFATLCGNGTVLSITIDEEGRKLSLHSSEPFFNVVDDPVFMPAGREGTSWYFISFEGQVHRVDFSAAVPVADAPWSLLGSGDAGWRPGGLQHVALHEGLGLLYVAMHEGGAGTHKDAGPEVWSFDLKKKKRVLRIKPPNLTAAFMAAVIGVAPQSSTHSLMDWLLPNEGVHTLTVSRDAEPVLFMRNAGLGAVAVVDARSGETLRILGEAGFAGPNLGVP